MDTYKPEESFLLDRLHWAIGKEAVLIVGFVVGFLLLMITSGI